jgi:hypothetical protein
MVKYREISLIVFALVLFLAAGFWPKVGMARYHGPNILRGSHIGARPCCRAAIFRLRAYVSCVAGLAWPGRRLALGFPRRCSHCRYSQPDLLNGQPIPSGQMAFIPPVLDGLGGNVAFGAGGVGKRGHGGSWLDAATAKAAVAAGTGTAPGLTALAPRGVHYRAILLATPEFPWDQAGAAFGRQWVGFGVRPGMRFTHAIFCGPGRGRIIDLNPKGFLFSVALGVNENNQVGAGEASGDKVGGALLWSGSAKSVIFLNPKGYKFSQAQAVRGGEEVGYAETMADRKHAALWRGTAASFKDLNPKGFVASDANATNGARQVGWGRLASGAVHALLWSGSARRVADLNPRNCGTSRACGISGAVVVGYGHPRGAKSRHALLWPRLGSRRVVDLNPVGCSESLAMATNSKCEVGAYIPRSGGLARACVWSGSAVSLVDLQALLPKRFRYSEALAITRGGDIFGWAASHRRRLFVAVMWVPVGRRGRALRKDGASRAKQTLPEVPVAPVPTRRK